MSKIGSITYVIGAVVMSLAFLSGIGKFIYDMKNGIETYDSLWNGFILLIEVGVVGAVFLVIGMVIMFKAD